MRTEQVLIKLDINAIEEYVIIIIIYIYVMELGKVINNCVHGVKYAVLGKDGSLEWKSKAEFQYADDVCLRACSEEDMNVIMEK